MANINIPKQNLRRFSFWTEGVNIEVRATLTILVSNDEGDVNVKNCTYKLTNISYWTI